MTPILPGIARNPSLLLLIVLAACNYTGLGDPPADNLREELRVTPRAETVACEVFDDALVRPPEWALEPDIGCDRQTETYCFRASAALRAVAASHDPRVALRASADAFEAHLATGDPTDRERGLAFADLAVTGAASHAAFASSPPTAEDLDSFSEEARSMALERAYAVAWALRGPPAHRAARRAELGFIAVSPEDDLPARPVNVHGTPFTQHDLPVSLTLEDGSARTLRARVAVASTSPAPDAAVPEQLIGLLPEEGPPTIPGSGSVLLFVHGHSSRAEESDALAAELLEIHRGLGRDLTVVSVDLPGTGYTERVDPAELVASADPSLGQDVLLRFIEAFLISLVDTLEREHPGFTTRIAAVVGGSLGGNLSLRLAERADELPWVRRAVAWSPVSIDYTWTRARLLGGDDESFMDVVKHEAVRRTAHESEEAEDRGARSRYFVDGVMSVRKQSNYWYRDSFRPCGDRLVSEGLRQLGEVYDSRLRRFHYRLAYEQLVFSHIERSPDTGELRFRAIDIPLLLIAGEEDNSVPMQTHYFVERLAPHLEAPGRTLFLSNTGHAMHAERPRFLAETITSFVGAY